MSGNDLGEIKFDADNLYREESYTDLRVGELRRLVPIKTDGSEDADRKVFFTGQTHVMSPHGMLPVNCEIQAETLEEAIRKFPDAIRKSIEDLVTQAKEMQRQQASRIVVPEGGAGPMSPGGAAGPGGGKIQL